MKRVLITGFEPFGGEAINPSAEIARTLDGRVIAGRTVVGTVLPCVFGASIAELKRQLRAVKPELVICVGQAGGRCDITPERVAINIDDARIADNAGAQPIDTPVVRGGPAAYWSTLPIKAVVAALQGRGIRASVSQTAGTFVCNHVFYGLMHALKRRRVRGNVVRGGFVHVPYLPEQAKDGAASLPLEMMIAGIALVVETAVKRKRDVRVGDGRTH